MSSTCRQHTNLLATFSDRAYPANMVPSVPSVESDLPCRCVISETQNYGKLTIVSNDNDNDNAETQQQ